MPKYVVLVNWKEPPAGEAVPALGDPRKWERAAGKMLKDQQGKLEGLYWTMGAHDAVLLVDAPSPDAVGIFAVALASGGGVRTTTLPAFDSKAMKGMVDQGHALGKIHM
jgi:uncharacterized protein with GYD domain